MPENQRVIVYIDGYNLYFGLDYVYGGRYKWLDLQALSESFLKPDMTLVTVKYFTTKTTITPDANKRQAIYLKALDTYCNKLEFYYGKFFSKKNKCGKCGYKRVTPKEKMTDVNIACHILNDAHFDFYDCCYIVSGDSDLLPLVEMVKENYPDKHIIVAHPPERKSDALCDMANGSFAIGKHKLKRSQLPNKITIANGKELIKPIEWQ